MVIPSRRLSIPMAMAMPMPKEPIEEGEEELSCLPVHLLLPHSPNHSCECDGISNDDTDTRRVLHTGTHMTDFHGTDLCYYSS